jgi:two-component system LytT family response regulator
MAIRALIVDDEPLARESILALLETERDVSVVGECGDGRSAVRAIQTQRPDVVFLDVKLPEMDGFEVLEALPRERLPSIIFVTAYDRFALRAFKVHAVDYLLKPVEDKPFHEALRQFRKRLGGLDPDETLRQRLAGLVDDLRLLRQPSDRLVVNSGNDVLCLKLREIDWIESAGNYVCLHVGGITHIVDETMHGLEQRLSSRNFIRIHRSRIVNFERIRRISPLLYGDHVVELHDGTKLTLSRSYRETVLSRIKGQ